MIPDHHEDLEDAKASLGLVFFYFSLLQFSFYFTNM
jgi:hypothetical protein